MINEISFYEDARLVRMARLALRKSYLSNPNHIDLDYEDDMVKCTSKKCNKIIPKSLAVKVYYSNNRTRNLCPECWREYRRRQSERGGDNR